MDWTSQAPQLFIGLPVEGTQVCECVYNHFYRNNIIMMVRVL